MAAKEDEFPEFGEMEPTCNKLYNYLHHIIENTNNPNTEKPLYIRRYYTSSCVARIAH